MDEEHSFLTANRTYGLSGLRQAMNYDKEWFRRNRGGSAETQTAKNYNAVSHCEYLRLRKFDVRHVAECMKHSMLCGGKGALLLPANDRGSCQVKSSAAKLENAAEASPEDAVSDMW